MKKISLILVMLVMIQSVVSANAIDHPSPTSGMAIMKIGSTVKVFYKGVKAGPVKIVILDENGKIVFTETFRKVENFIRPYNFSSLKEGNYTIELSDADGKQVEQVVYTKGGIQRLAHLARLVGATDKYILSLVNKGEDVIVVKVYDSSNAIIYNQQETISGDFAKIYNLKKVTGPVTFAITDKNGITTTLQY
jgi:hypothetical protein